MKNGPLKLLIGLTQERIERLKQTVNTLPKKQHALFDEALEGFSAILEELQAAEEELRTEGKRQEELIKLASFPELNPNPVVEIDLNGHIRYRNPAAQRLFPDLQTAGFDHPWLVGLERLFEIVDHKGENTHVREVKVGDFWFAQSIHSVNDGQRLRIYGLDITERKRSEDELRKREESFRALAENSPDVIERFDEEIRHIYVNPLAAKLHGISAEALIGKTNQEIGVPQHYCRFWKERIQKVFKTGQAIEEENEFATTSGKRVYQSRLVPEKAKDGTVTSVLVASRDVTNRKRAEETLRESEMRRRLNAQILIAQENERKLIAHEIHDSFGSQLAFVKITVVNFLRQIDRNLIGREVESLESVIPLLQESIQEGRRIQMNLRPSILDDLGILSTIEWFCRIFGEAYPNIHVEKEIIVEENDVSIPLKTVIYRILQEAMNNIAKHSEADLVRLSLRKTEGKVELFVQDNGQGFNLKEVVGSESSMQGFGLVSMRERANLSGGSFSIDSIEGEGTTLRSSWPLSIAG